MKRVIILQIVLLASVAAAATDPNLVGWWKFDEGNGTIASDSAGSNNGNLINGPTWTTGQIGGALRFDGINDYVEVPINASLEPGYITLSAWIQTDILPSGMMLIGKCNYFNGTSEQYDLGMYPDGSPMSSIKRNGLCALGQGWNIVHASRSITAGQWCLVTSTWDGSVFKIYIDGELNNSNSTIPAGLIDSCPGGTLRFGIWWAQSKYPFQGVMDDVRIYNRALSAEEIQELAHPAETDSNLVGWWKFDEGAGTIAHDSAGNNDGNLINGPTWTTGQIGGGLIFDGVNDYVEVPINASLEPGYITLSAWVRPDTLSRDMVLIGKSNYSDATAEQYDLAIKPSGTPYSAIKRNSSCAAGQGWKGIFSTHYLTVGQWCLVTSTWDGSVFKIYINGELNNSDSNFPAGAIDYCPGGTLRFGIWWMQGLCAFKGVMDDVRIYNRALSADEIQKLYEVALPTLTGLEITGPDEVAEESTASYKAVAQYDDGTTKDVTALAKWRVEPNNVAAIDAGQLITGEALYPKHKVKVYAEYTEEQTTVDAEKQISVFAICPQGNALMFDGVNDYLELGSPANLDNLPLRDLTISAWIYDKHSAGNTWGTIFGTYIGSTYNGWTLRTFSNTAGSRSLYLQVPSNGYNINSWATHQSGYGTILSNRWHHVVSVWNSSTKTAKLYIDGAEPSYQVTHPGVGTYNSDASNNKEVGRIPHAGDMQYFNGTIDDVRIYNRALSAEEIETVMYSKPIGSDPNLVAYWDFDEGAGQTAADVSGHGNNGVLGSSTGIDTADPCWVESDAPVGLCTTEQVMLRNLLGATDNKKIANQLIADAKAKERASVQLITDLQKQMNSKERMNATRAKAQISVAIVQEEIASRQIDATIKRLEDALRLLNYEVDSNSGPTWFPPWHPWPGVNNKTNALNWPSSYDNKPTGKQSH